VWVNDGFIDYDASSITVSAGPHQADGTDAYTVTANFVSYCHLPVTSLGTDVRNNQDLYQVSLVASDPKTGKAAPDAVISDWVADPAKPGTYTATVTSKVVGEYALDVLATYQPLLPPLYLKEAGTEPINEKPMVVAFVAPGTTTPGGTPGGTGGTSAGGTSGATGQTAKPDVKTGGTVETGTGMAGLAAGIVLLLGGAVLIGRRLQRR